MTLHRRLEERLAGFTGQRAALLFGSGALANMGVIAALARRGEIVLHDELSHCSIVDGCRLSGAEVLPYRHADPEHLAWTLRQCDGRATLIATDGMFGMDGDVAPLAEIVELAHHYDARVLVDEAHAFGALGPGGRGAVAEAGLESAVDVITGTLGKALGSYGGFVACDHVTARFLVHSARTLLHSTALPPVAAAAAMAALDLLEEQPRRVDKLRANAEALRDGLAREGFEVSGAAAHVIPLVVGDAELASRIVDHALELGVFAEAVRPPAVPEGTARVRLSVMASHTRQELRGAATTLGRAALRAGFRPGAGIPVAAAHGAVFDGQAPLARAA
jgi:glycine C-acetyltransferase/8-amino-7-oxononanoate synthase